MNRLDPGDPTPPRGRPSARRTSRTDGAVLGIEASQTMLAEARGGAASTALPIEFRRGDITNLELDDATYDGVHCEHVFQHLATPGAALGHLVRITRPGGRIAATDTDWGLQAIHGADPTHNAANGYAGGQLPALFADAGRRAASSGR
jgi:SAM-dependent methyltransferase